jgi:hypothetical protein
MSNPPEPTNLSQKFAALQELMTAQHDALKAEIAALRGTGGPETTLRSINQSIWNLAGAAPGRSLSDLYDILTYQDGSILWTTAGAINAVRLALHNADQTLDAGDLLTAINNAIGGAPNNDLELASVRGFLNNIMSATIKSEMIRLLAQFDTSVVYPTMKDLLITISQQQAQLVENTQDPLLRQPPDVCASPFTSSGIIYLPISAQLISATTYATWPTSVPDGFDGLTTESGGIAVGQTIVRCADWTQYKIYVASNATEFGIGGVGIQKFNTNEWIVLSGNNSSFEFYTMGDQNLKVYICPVGAPVLGGCPSAATNPLRVTAWHNIAPPDLPWYAAAFTGGANWTTNVAMMIEGTLAQTGFTITVDGDVDMCFAWDVSAEPTVSTLGLHAYYEAFPGQWSLIEFTGVVISVGTSGTHASTVITVTGLQTAPYQLADVVFVPYLVFTDNHQIAPDVSFQISYLPSGWNAS